MAHGGGSASWAVAVPAVWPCFKPQKNEMYFFFKKNPKQKEKRKKMRMRREYFLAWAILNLLSFMGGLVWSICAIAIMRDKTHVVAGVGLLGTSAVSGVWSSMTYILWGARVVPGVTLGPAVTIDVREKRRDHCVRLELSDEAVVCVGTNTTETTVVVFDPVYTFPNEDFEGINVFMGLKSVI